LFEIIPPLALPPLLVSVPSPRTERPPFEPVLSRMMPVAVPPLEPMLRNVRPLAPILVLVTFSAVAVVVASVLLAPVTVTVPPPVAAKAALVPVESVRPPEKAIVEPVLLDNETPAPEVTFIVPA